MSTTTTDNTLTFPVQTITPSEIKEVGFFGNKYNSNRSPTECAKCIRADIKALVKSGELPKGKYSVVTRHHNAIDVKISGLPFVVLNRKRVSFNVQHPYVSMSNADMCQCTGPGKALLAKVAKLVNTYNRDQSDHMTDYFSVHFYESVNFCWKWTNAQRKEMEAQEKEDPSFEFELDADRRLRSTKDLKFRQGNCPVPPTPKGMDHTAHLISCNCD